MNHTKIKYCCVGCFDDDAIKAEIESQNTNADCDFCEAKHVGCAPADELGAFILKCVEKKYQDAAESVSYVSAEGGYQLPTQLIGEILIDEEMIFSEAVKDPMTLAHALIPFDGTPYVRIDPYGPDSGGGDEIKEWEGFAARVKGSRRFTALHLFDDSDETGQHSASFLTELAEILNRRLVVHLQVGGKIYRARKAKEGVTFQHKDLTSPPKEKSKNSRMSARGVRAFYGAMEEITAVAEMLPSVGERVALAEFTLLNELTILDLAGSIPNRNIFNPDYDFHLDEFIYPFIRHFAASIARPISKDEVEIDYLPTQVFTEFLRFLPRHAVHGIRYRSSLNQSGANIVLFKEEGISTEDTSDHDAWLAYKGHKIVEITNLTLGYEVIS